MELYELAYCEHHEAMVGIPRAGMKSHFWIWLKKSQKVLFFKIKNEKTHYHFLDALYTGVNLGDVLKRNDEFQYGVSFEKYVLPLN